MDVCNDFKLIASLIIRQETIYISLIIEGFSSIDLY